MRRMLIIATVLTLTCAVRARAAEPPTWETVAAFIENEAERGFSGQVLLVRHGAIVLNKAYGMADRQNELPNTPETIFALGSTPIDFTLVSVLQLIGEGRLGFDDPVTKFFPDLPEDKRAITVAFLLHGLSGLPDFVNKPGIDASPDHTFISRNQFIDRIRESELLFAPGQGNAHSHAAWCLLAAIVEIASGKTYQAYVRERILKPAGMTRTGFYGEAFPGERVAVGYGARSWGEVNTPTEWGPPSWLVLGSGGMVGTTGDLFQFHEALMDGRLLSEKMLRHYPQEGLYANGDMYGFETMYNFGGPNRFYVNCNSSDLIDGYSLEPLGEALHALCQDRPPARFSIGMAVSIEDDLVTVAEVVPGSPAEKAGLRAGDELIDGNGIPFAGNDAYRPLRSAMTRGEPLELRIVRDGKRLTIAIKPTPIDR